MKTTLFFYLLIGSLLSGCITIQRVQPQVIRIKGSDTFLHLTQLLAERYMSKNESVSIYVSGGGSASGISALIQGDVEISASSRPLKPEESQVLAGKYQTVGISFLIGKDALSIYLHPDHQVNNLSITQVKDIFTGKITNWKYVGGQDDVIQVFNRSPNSGSFLYFKEHVLDNENFTDSEFIAPTTDAIAFAISTNEKAIGYGGISHFGKVKHVKINGVEPTIERVLDDTYPISRYLYFQVVNSPKGQIKLFIDWVQSPEGQKIIEESGFIPLYR